MTTRRAATRARTAPPAASRDRARTEARILDAVGRVLAREGFASVGVNAVAREAGVDKVLIYRYFGGLAELLAAYGTSGGFWPSVDEVLGTDDPDAASGSLPDQLSQLLVSFVAALRARPLTIEILAWETVARNELTTSLEAVRERWGEEIERRLRARHPDIAFDVTALMVLFMSAVQYLLVRSRTVRIFGGVDLQADPGWERLVGVMGAALERVLAKD